MFYQTQYTDPTTNDVLMQARWYTPASGTFRSRDTYSGNLNTPVSLNRYTYAHNNPIRYWDPTGRCIDFSKQACWEAQHPGVRSDKIAQNPFIAPAGGGAKVDPATVGVAEGTIVYENKTTTSSQEARYLVYVNLIEVSNDFDDRAYRDEVNYGDFIGFEDVSATGLASGAYGHQQGSKATGRDILEIATSPPVIGDVADFGWCAYDGIKSLFGGSDANAGFSCGAAVAPFATAAGAGIIRNFGDDAIEALADASRTLPSGPGSLSTRQRALALQNVTNSGDTVLGRYPGYINKANSRGASYFDIGNDWDQLVSQGVDPWHLNVEFLETIASRGDRVLLSVPKVDIPVGGYLRQEVNHLVNDLDYVWVNQWSLRPRG